MRMWHIDGNHKLIKWKFVIHGGIDGYSRCVVYLKFNPDNRATIVLSCFREACAKWGVPSRTRSDYGMENIQVADFMINYRGAVISAELLCITNGSSDYGVTSTER